MMHKTKQPTKPQKATSLSQEDKRILGEFIEDNRSLLQKLSKL